MKVEYKVRPVTRYVVTRFHQLGDSAGVETLGEFTHLPYANRTAQALADREGGSCCGYPDDSREP